MTLEELKAKLQQIKDAVPLDVVEMSKVQQEIDALEQSQAQEQRVQTQEEKVQSITLPYNFNDLYDNSTANETIIELIQQDRRQVYADHNAEIEKIQADCREQLRAAEEREVQIKRQNDELQHQLEQESSQLAMVITDRDQARKDLQQFTLERDDAIAKRDAAVRELEDAKREIERLNGHINDLRTDAAVGARNTPNVINANDKLDQLVKQSAAEKATRAIAQWNARNADIAVPPLGVASAPATFPNTQPQDSTVHNGDTAASTAPIQPPGVTPPATFPPNDGQVPVGEGSQGQATSSDGATITREEFEALKGRVAVIERHANLPGVA